MATDARDCSVERTLHTEGEEAAELRRKNWEANAHYAFAGVDGVRLFSYTNVGMLEVRMGKDEGKDCPWIGLFFKLGSLVFLNDKLINFHS